MARGDGRETAVGGPLLARARRVSATPVDALSQPSRDALADADDEWLPAADEPRVAWAAPEGATMVGCGAAVTVTADGSGRFSGVRDRARAQFERLDYHGPAAARPRFLGGFAFDERAPTRPWEGFPAGYVLLPRLQVVRAGGTTWLTVVASADVAAGDPDPVPEGAIDATLDRAESAISAAGPAPGAGDRPAPDPPDAADPPGVARTAHDPPRETWEAGVAAAVERIAAGDLEKVVLAGSLVADLGVPVDVATLLRRFGDAYPGCYRFAVDPGEGTQFFGATPELLVDHEGSSVRTTALAGSVERGEDPTRDRRRASELVEGEAARGEHGLVVEDVRDRLAPYLDAVTVGERSVRKLATVQHLETPIDGQLTDDTHVLELADALHPTPAVGGLPRDAARAVIRETERFDRGWYAGPVGWFDAAGDGTFAVAIRSALAAGDRATLFAGNGIVADSDPAAEWEELQLKYRSVLDQLR